MESKKKNSVVKLIVFVLCVIGTGFAIYFNTELFGENSIFNKNVSSNEIVNVLYQKIPAVIRTVEIITLSILTYYIAGLVLKIMYNKSKRGATISKLLTSFLKWAIFIGATMIVLGAWGIDTTTLLASAGVLTLIVGLGAQSLVADIVAGLFIVFEGEFEVGDIVVINNWRGTVTEIGIRTTKIVDAGGNINIVNNSEITTIINQTQEVSLATCTVGIEYSESIQRVELIVQQNLDKVKQNIPAIIEGPYYKGVSALAESSVNLLFVAKCKEEDIFQVQRDMNREFKILFDENGINIPFAQIVINKPNDASNKISEMQKEQARKFVEEQKTLSSDLESEDDNK